ncbi:intraflagellar transport protein 140 homolog isoform X2 [Galleria mellonella]|uniref:Intraflagellar transport protein 140 homolog isoform X2 n=1 Tax=Galleria mellonella TaxID=7137 RepID=A0ABM3N781_GALME|nr:intraflagellar transport protein 140 homolog isoform X2 [Galleria mellonella]
MTLYIDTKLTFTDNNVVSTVGSWHPSLPLLAVGSYSQEKGGFVTIFHENGLPLEGCEWPILLSNQVTALAWHPTRRLLVVGWDGGELYIWLEYSWARLEAPHNAALTTVAFSLGGGRLLASDTAGSLSGWQSASGAPLTSFHHQLGDVITHVTFCSPRPNSESSIRGLARAAVAGDENALDALAAWRPRTTARIKEGSQPDNHACYAAQDNGVILYIDHTGACSEVLNASGNIIFMGVISNIYLLVAWESGGALSLTRLFTADDGSLTTDTHVRMAARNGQCIVLAGNYNVAVITGDNLIRVWDSETGDNDALPNEKEEIATGDIFTSINYCNLSDTLCCGTSQGHLYLWRRDHRNQWKLISSTTVKGTVKEVSWGSEGLMNPLLYVNCITSAYILREQPVSWGYSPNVWMVQKSANELAICNKNNFTSTINTSVTVRAFAFKDQYVALGDGKEVQIWMCSKDNEINFSLIRTFSWKTDVLIIYNDILVGVVNPHIECYTITGNSLGILPSTEGEGEPIGITNTSRFIVIATMDGTLKLAEITKKGLRMPYPPKNCYQMIEDFGEVMRASVNSTGRYICLSIANAGLAPDPRLYLWDVANDVISNTLVSNENSTPPYQSVPIAILWDNNDSRLVAVHMRSADIDRIHLFICHEGKLYEYKNWCSSSEVNFTTDFMLCSLYTPHLIILSQQNLKKILMREFEDIPDYDPSNIRQVLDFLYYMTTGHLEKAVVIGSSISGGKNTVIWDSLAKECVSRKRPDVGAVCLSKMGNIKGALMLRKAMNADDIDDSCKIGILAVNLDMIDEAESLFREAERPDLITRLISAKEGGLNDITNGANEGENILLIKSAQHKLAKVLWSNGETGAALKLFEAAGTLVPHVPRNLIAQGQAPILAQYVSKSNDVSLITWWGHYLESIGDLDGALEAYARANDFGEQTRLLCHMDRIDEAEKLCHMNSSSLYQMARYLEMQPDKTENAVKMYIKCGAISSAIRVAAEASAWNLVWRAGSVSSTHALHAASILENAGQNEQAITLYQKAGKPHMALKLAVSSGDTNAMIAAVESLGDRVDPEVAHTLASHLKKADHHSHAAALLATAGNYEEALDIMEQSSAPLSEELSERLAAPAGTSGRDALLRRLADVLGARGLYHQAAKRLAHAGDKACAMRWLMRSGDVDRIAVFAAAARDRGAQLMAADYLRRRADWRARPDLARHILHFYTRARAYGKLAAFYADCAKMEVDEYDNYEKALEALKEAAKCLAKSSDPESGAQTVAIQEQSTLVKRFLDVKKTLEAGEINTGVTSGQQLLRALSGRSGLITEVKVLKLLLQFAATHPDATKFEEQLRALQKRPEEENNSTDSPEQSIEEII